MVNKSIELVENVVKIIVFFFERPILRPLAPLLFELGV